MTPEEIELQRQIEQLQQQLQAMQATNVQVGKDLVGGDKIEGNQYNADNIHINNPPAPEPHVAGRHTYLMELFQQCNLLPLAAMGGQEEMGQGVGLDRVYTRLDTTTRVKLTEAEKEAYKKQERYAPDERPLTAEEAIQQNRCVVILGGPGSGKSSFVRQLAANAARQPSAPLPLFLTLRDLPPHLRHISLGEFVTTDQRAQLRQAVFAQWRLDIERQQGGALVEKLGQLVSDGQVLLIFDGLDEVPPDSRRAVREAILSVVHPRLERVIVTCRTRSYVGEAQLPHFATFTLAPFNANQIRAFAHAWYVAQRNLGRLDEAQAQAKIADLQRAATDKMMMPLAEIPLLLTTMTIIHQTDKELPKQRVLLYQQVVVLLARRWQKEKEQGSQPVSEALRQLIHDESNKLTLLLQQLAYALHEQQAQQKEARLGRYQIIQLLEKEGHPLAIIEELLDYIDNRAGVLAGYGGGEGKPSEYDFLHRTFQEYLVGCQLVRGRTRDVQWQYKTVVEQGDYWYVAAQLGAESLIFPPARYEDVADVVYALSPAEQEPNTPAAWRAVIWAAYLATLVGTTWVDRHAPLAWADCLHRLRRRLVALIEDTACPLNLFERAEAGRMLGQLGDPRAGVGVRDGVPDLAWGGVVPAGKYTIGGDGKYDGKVRPVEIRADYQLAKYPVTYVQFQCFVEADDFGDAKWWEGMPEEERQIAPSPSWPYANHPRVQVTWYQAVAFGRWLSDKLGDEVRLPNEQEWEVAARYNDGRAYPWGDEFDPAKANTWESQLMQTTAVGLYPSGRQPHLNLYDMSGNVWEWCQNKYEDPTQDGVDGSGDSRVWRGGSWNADQVDARAAYRYYYRPSYRLGALGLRLVRCVSSSISS